MTHLVTVHDTDPRKLLVLFKEEGTVRARHLSLTRAVAKGQLGKGENGLRLVKPPTATHLPT
jgi:hypothetical protein